MTPLPDWAQTVADFRERFGPGVKVTHLALTAVPGYQLGMSIEDGIGRTGERLETYEHNMPGFGPPVEDTYMALPTGWKLRGAQ